MDDIKLKDIHRGNRSVHFTFSVPKSLGSVFTAQSFWIEYDTDIRNVPEGVLIIPFVANVAPISWFSGCDISVPTLDSNFMESLEELRKVFADFYPKIGFNKTDSTIRVDHESEGCSSLVGDGRPATLFSGGVDSLTTYIRHREESPRLIQVKKTEDEYDGHWEERFQQTQDLAMNEGLEAHQIHSNFYDVLSTYYLKTIHSDSIYFSWWGNIQHGLAYLSVCAPLTVAKNIPRLYIASTHTEGYDHAWGSHPDIDEKVSWAGVDCVHDGYQLTRQDKWRVIAEYFESYDENIIVQSNCAPPRNCNSCFQCARNIVGTTLAGTDPEMYGYNVTDEIFDTIRRNIQDGTWIMDPDNQFFWEDIQDDIPEDIQNSDLISDDQEAFSKWLRDQDFSEYDWDRGSDPSNMEKAYWSLERTSPTLAHLAKKIYHITNL